MSINIYNIAIIKKQYFNNNKILLRNYKFKLDIKKLIIKEHFLIAVLKIDGRPRSRNITFDGISLLEAGNTNKSICLCLIMQV